MVRRETFTVSICFVRLGQILAQEITGAVLYKRTRFLVRYITIPTAWQLLRHFSLAIVLYTGAFNNLAAFEVGM